MPLPRRRQAILAREGTGSTMIRIDGSRFSGSGAIVRLSVALSALTGQDVHIVNARVGAPTPGLQNQHTWAVEALRRLSGGTTAGNFVGSRELIFRPGRDLQFRPQYCWDVGPAGSTTLLALAVMPLLAFASRPVEVELRGGVFMDGAPSFYHLRHVVLPLLWRMGVAVDLDMRRPGFVPDGKGSLKLSVSPMVGPLKPLIAEEQGTVERVWGVAVSSHLEARNVSRRMARAAQRTLQAQGYEAEFELVHDKTAVQPGAAMAVFADLSHGTRLGADRASAPRRRIETVGATAARQLVDDLRSSATVDRYAADQVLTFASLAEGESCFVVPPVTRHLAAVGWLAEEFLGATLRVQGQRVTIQGARFSSEAPHHALVPA